MFFLTGTYINDFPDWKSYLSHTIVIVKQETYDNALVCYIVMLRTLLISILSKSTGCAYWNCVLYFMNHEEVSLVSLRLQRFLDQV